MTGHYSLAHKTMLWEEKEVTEIEISKKMFFNNFKPFFITNKKPWWAIDKLYGVMGVKGTMVNIIEYLNTVYWPIN
jgi:hypothetical protein